MDDQAKTREQLIDELVSLKGRLANIEKKDAERNRAEEALQESEDKFRMLAESTVAAIYMARADGRMLYTNPAYNKITGYTAEEILAMPNPAGVMIHPDYWQLIMELMIAHLGGQESLTRYQIKIVKKGGEDRWVENSPIMIEYEGKSTLISIAIDITELKQAMYRLRKSLSATVQAMAAIVETRDPYTAGQISEESLIWPVSLQRKWLHYSGMIFSKEKNRVPSCRCLSPPESTVIRLLPLRR